MRPALADRVQRPPRDVASRGAGGQSFRGSALTGEYRNLRLAGTVLTMAALLALASPSSADDTLRLSQDLPGEARPVILSADQVFTWAEGSTKIFLLRGAVLVEQGVVHARMQGAVVWADLDLTGRRGVLHLDLYAEGDVFLETGARVQSGQKALVQLNTRGDLRLSTRDHRVVVQKNAADPLYQRATAQRNREAAMTPAPSPERTSFSEPGPPDPGLPRSPIAMPAQGASPPPTSPPLPVPPPLLAPSTIAPQQLPAASAAPVVPVLPTPPVPKPSPPPPGIPSTSAPGPPRAPVAPGPPRQLRIVQRGQNRFQFQTATAPNGEQALIVTGGVIVSVNNVEGPGLLDIEADQLVVWSKGNPQHVFDTLRGQPAQAPSELELYLSGNVEIREQNGPEARRLAADEVYYDVARHVAIARQADLELKQPGLPDPMHLRAERLEQLSPTMFRVVRAEVFSSRLPSDPGLKLSVREGTLEEKQVVKRNLFGQPRLDRNGRPETDQQRLFHGESVFVELDSVPIFYLPFVQGDANDPLGPLKDARLDYNRVFGFRSLLTFNTYNLLGLDPQPGTHWDLDLDYMSSRGPALGTNFDYAGNHLLGVDGKYNGVVKAYGIDDTGKDILGNGRGENEPHPELRGRFLWRNRWELPGDFTLQTQVAPISDKNFLDQYFQTEFELDVPQETYLYFKQQRDQWAWTLLAEPRIRTWVTETEWLPRADGYLIGQTVDLPILDRLTYNAHASAAYARLLTTNVGPPAINPTDVRDDTARLDLMQELSLPFYAGPFRVVPYVVSDLAYYSSDLTGNERGRAFEGGGIRGSIPFTRLYPDARSDLLNLDGINHKIVLSGNFFSAHSDTPHTMLPQLDRLDDDATDQARRDIKPFEPLFNPDKGPALRTSPVYDPQLYAIRRLVDNRIDTLDTIEELEFDVRQRWQTKRGFPGNEHVLDWMTLDLSGSLFPQSRRDNFGDNFAFLQYDWVWNVGDRTALVSSGWVDPEQDGPRVFSFGAFLNRPDRTNFYLGFRTIEPLHSDLISGAVTYVFSPKYSATANVSYDVSSQPNIASGQLVLTRTGSDLQLSVGVTYNSLLNNFGAIVEITPNLVPGGRRIPGLPAFGSSTLGR